MSDPKWFLIVLGSAVFGETFDRTFALRVSSLNFKKVLHSLASQRCAIVLGMFDMEPLH